MIRLAPVAPAQRAALLDLWVEAWRRTMPQIDFEARRGWFSDHLDDLVARGAMLTGGFDAADILLGFVTVEPLTGALDQICVSPSAQGSDVARRLLDEAKRLSPQRLVLSVNLDNPRALRFYEREGFVQGERGSNPKSGLPTVQMIWMPSPPL